MASRILFEDDIDDQILKTKEHKSNENITIKQDIQTNEDNCGQRNNNDNNIIDNETIGDSDYTQPTVISKIKISNCNDTCEGNTDQSVDKNANITNSLQEKNKQVISIEGNTNKNSEKNYQKGNNGLSPTDEEGNNGLSPTGEEGNNDQSPIDEEGNNSLSPTDEKGKGNKMKGKKRISKFELLNLDLKKDDEDSDGLYDVFGDDNKIFRKYKLRKSEQKISYKEPPDLKPKRRISTDEETNLSCTICQQEFETKRSLHNHLRIHNKTVHKYNCSICSKKFEKNSELIAHRVKHSTESFLCKECKLAFSDYSDFLLHNYEHINKPHFQCPECGLRYRKSFYKMHILRHFDKKVSCHLCPFVTNGEHYLKKHLNQHKYKLTCVECGKDFNNRSSYDYHISMHTGVKKFQCLYCGACFRNHSARKVHTRIHTGEKPYTCEICGHKSRQSADMKRHKEIHDLGKKYTCDVCGKKYLHKDYLVIHMRSHTKSSLYECPECDAGFVSVTGLKVHTMFKHTSERPVECTLCDKKFINNNQYRKHCRAKYHLRNVYGQKMNNEKSEE